MRGNPWAASSPATRASRLEAAGRQSTRTGGPNEAATAAVSSVQPLATTITSSSAGGSVGPAEDTSWPSRRPITRASLCAGTMTLTTTGQYGRHRHDLGRVAGHTAGSHGERRGEGGRFAGPADRRRG